MRLHRPGIILDSRSSVFNPSSESASVTAHREHDYEGRGHEGDRRIWDVARRAALDMP